MSSSNQPTRVDRVLIVHPFGIGDVLFMTPVIRALREAGAQKIDLLLGSRTKELFAHNPMVNDIFVIDRDRLKVQSGIQNVREISTLLTTLRKNRYDTLFDFSLSREYAFWATFFVNIPQRIGFDYKKRGIFLTKKIELAKSFSDKHVVDYYMDLLNFLWLPSSQRSLEVFVSDQDQIEASRVLKELKVREPFLAIAPGGGGSWGKDARLKHWPVRFFFSLFEKIEISAKGERLSVVILGSKNEYKLGESLREFAPNQFHNLCGKLSLMGSAAVLKRARLLIANDSGLVHMASALKTPVVGLYGPVDPKVYGPYPESSDRIAVNNDGPACRPCYQNMRYQADCRHVDCLNTLSPEAVFATLEKRGFLNIVTHQFSRYE